VTSGTAEEAEIRTDDLRENGGGCPSHERIVFRRYARWALGRAPEHEEKGASMNILTWLILVLVVLVVLIVAFVVTRRRRRAGGVVAVQRRQRR
jgi:hypothetical protein